MFDSVKLYNFGGIIAEPKIEIPEKDIIAAIKYNDHGDDFIAIKTHDGVFIYGWFLNRYFYPEYDEIDRNPTEYVGTNKRFMRAPKLYCEKGYYVQTANRMYEYTKLYLVDKYGNVRKPVDVNPQYIFNSYIGMMHLFSQDQCPYHCDYSSEVIKFLAYNDILEENVDKLDLLKKYWRVDEIDGYAGIIKSDETIVGDSVDWIWHHGEYVNSNNVIYDDITENTDFGLFDQFLLDTDQFN